MHSMGVLAVKITELCNYSDARLLGCRVGSLEKCHLAFCG